jgi:glycosyltransferase involved in cell wall biosynthesis
MNESPHAAEIPSLASGPQARLKVCHVSATSEGATWMFEQLRELRDRHNCEVVAVVPDDHGSLVEKLRSANIRYQVIKIAFNLGPVGELRKMIAAILELARFFRRERFDVVQTHIFLTLLTARPAAWLADVPVRTAMIASPFPLQAPSSRAIERLTYWMDTALIPSCQFSLDLCRELNIPEKFLAPVIYYSPDERNFDPQNLSAANIRGEFGWPPDTPVICMVAYFYPRLPPSRWSPKAVHKRGIKGHEDLVRAAPIILREFPSAKFLLVGSGWSAGGEAHFADVRTLVESLRLQESVILPGYRADANKILCDADVAVQASLVENLGGSIEALLMGCPTVATRVGGLVDSVRDGETGVLVSPSNPNDLARGILELLRDRKRAKALGTAGRALMLEKFTLRRTANDLARLYRRLLDQERGRRNFYNPLVSFARLCAGIPLLSFLFFRYLFLDLYLPLYFRGDLSRFFSFRHGRYGLLRYYYYVRYLPFRILARVRTRRTSHRRRT